ncbi:hypothetical protein [Streptomyces sp. NPDC003299]
MIPLVRYLCTVLLLSQRYLAPVLLFLGLVAVLTSSDTGPLTATYASVAGVMLLSSVWLTMALVALEDRPHRAIVIASAGGDLRVLVATVAAAGVWCLLLAVVGVALPLAFGAHSPGPGDLTLGLLAQLTCAAMGVGIGLVCSRLVFRRQGYALAVALILLLAVLLSRGVSPVNLMLTRLQNTPDATAALIPTAALFGTAIGCLAAAVALTQVISRRRA